MLSTITLVLASFLLIVTNAIPIIKHEQGFEYGGLERTFSSDYPSKKQLVLHGPEISHDLPPYSEGVFDSFGHHLTGQNINLSESFNIRYFKRPRIYLTIVYFTERIN